MNSPLAAVIARSGLLDASTLDEFRRWGMAVDELPLEQKPTSAAELIEALERALQDEGLVMERLTDLEAVKCYLSTQKIGTLHVEVDGEQADFQVVYGRSELGEYLLPWKGESVAEEMTNGLTYLTPEGSDDKIYFSNLRELFFGNQKSFMACTPWQDGMVAHGARQ